jgi:hypothetical protein
MMDANSNLRDGDCARQMNRAGYRDTLLKKRGNEKVNSFYRGSNVIDGIFTSSTLVTTGGEYQPFSISPGDHRGIWIVVSTDTALGNNNPVLTPRSPRRLQCHQVQTVRGYNEILNQFIDKRKLK